MITKCIQVSQYIDEVYDAITSDNVKTALLARTRDFKKTSPMEHLTVIEQYISEVMFPECAYARKLALEGMLADIITNELNRHRRIMELPFTPGEYPISNAFKAIVGDGKTSNVQLIGWSWLYYRFVRIELDISQKKFCKLVHLDDRTIRRYENIAIGRIREIIIDKEWKARQSHILASQTILNNEFTQVEMKIILKLYTILEMIRTDQSLLCAFAAFLEAAKNDERAAS